MIKSAIGSIFKAVIFFVLAAGGVTYGLKKFSQEVKVTAHNEVYKSLHSKNNLETYTEKMTGIKGYLDNPPPKKNVLREMMKNVDKELSKKTR